MLSKNKISFINSLSLKKNRDESGLFVAEGTKLVLDMLSAFQCRLLLATSEWLAEHGSISALEILEISELELKKTSNQKTPQGVLAVFEKPTRSYDIKQLGGMLSLALDDVQDPGNLGTIIRIADWFGIQNLFCSLHTADAYSPKTVQATMGALARVHIHVVHLPEFLEQCSGNLPLYGTCMDGENIYHKPLTTNGIIIMGNEGNGIAANIEKWIDQRLLIPNFPAGVPTSESLNVGIATALVCAEFRRKISQSIYK